MRRPSTTGPTWPLALLLASLCCLGLAVNQAWRADRSNERVARSALWGYSNFVVWSYREHLTESLRAMAREALGAVNHGDQLHTSMKIPDPSELGHYLPWDPSCNCHVTRAGPLPARYLGFALGSDTLGQAVNHAPIGTPGWLEDGATAEGWERGPLDAQVARRLVDTMTRVARSGPSPWGYHMIALGGVDLGRSRLLVMTLMPTAHGDTMIYAVDYPDGALNQVLANVLDAPSIVPAALSSKGTNREILSMEVRDARARRLLAWHVPEEWRVATVETLPPSFGSMALQLELRPELTNLLTIGGLPRSRLPLLLALLTLTAGLTVVAMVQLRREGRFNRDRTTFVANVSHELRTPLAQIRLAVDTLRLRRETDPERQESALALVDREITRLQHLAEGVLRFSRGERPEEDVFREPVDLAAEVRRTVDEFAPLAAPRGVQVDVVVQEARTVALRAGALRQILLNLLDNAVKYGPDGQRIEVRLGSSIDGSAFLRVSDEGSGVSADDARRIWQPFERGAAASTHAAGGSGIGLTVVREIAEAHGGTASVTSGKVGASFEVTFPEVSG